ncbi:hypothetical protein [Alteribacter aurantiacus]|uniref:hypothetical protein n=1 Tax=Alteribacter aurantiacus TaxID=254410 RepID=UPI000479DDF1|nr:hypothetical protein [Alteribacter aurantiacus]
MLWFVTYILVLLFIFITSSKLVRIYEVDGSPGYLPLLFLCCLVCIFVLLVTKWISGSMK